MSAAPDCDDAPRPPAAAQLPLELPAEPRYGPEDFLVSHSNRTAFEMIGRWPDWTHPNLLLLGPPGAGKSHLCAIWAARVNALTVPPWDISALGRLSEAAPKALLLDGLDAVRDEAALFHLLNFASESGASMLMSARRPPSLDEVKLPDLLSRLRRAPIVEIGAADDDLMRAVLEKLLRDRQLVVDAPLVDYVALRLERSLDAARAFVRLLDREALAQGRRITRVLAGEVLEKFQGCREEAGKFIGREGDNVA